MDEVLKREFDVSEVSDLFAAHGGCINNGRTYQVGASKMFIKTNSHLHAEVMFNGEYEGLLAIQKTQTIRVPIPFKTFNVPSEKIYAIAMEYLDFSHSINHEKQLGHDLARLHLDNMEKLEKYKSTINRVGDNFQSGTSESPIEQFGFNVSTSCGLIPLDNTWSTDWVEFYTRQRLDNKIQLIMAEDGDRELNELWSTLQLMINRLFDGITVRPSLIHGDLWQGNVAHLTDTPVIFDPACFYGHHEFEMSITDMFGRFGQPFYEAYHSMIPKSRGFDQRHQLYMLFHYLNHWNHFGKGYRPKSLAIMKKLIKTIK